MKFKIAVDWEVSGEVEIEAKTFEGALFIAKSDSSIGLPEGEYIDGSWKVNEDMSRVLNEDIVKNMEYRGGRRFQLNPNLKEEEF